MTRQNRFWCASCVAGFIIIAIVLSFLLGLTGPNLWGTAPADRGADELHSIVVKSGGRPSDEDLHRFESKFPKTRTAALARFLRG